MSKKDRLTGRAAKAASLRAAQARSERNRNLALAGSVILAIVLIATAITWYYAKSDSTGTKSSATPAGVVGYTVTLGKKSAPLRVDIYEDFQCPHCRAFEEASRDDAQEAAAAGKVYLVYHPVAYLDDYSARAINAFLAVLNAKGGDAGMKMHNLLYDNQPDESGPYPTDAKLFDLAKQAGAGTTAVENAIDDMKYKSWITNANDTASKAGVNGIPTVLVGGQRFGENLADAALGQALVERIAAG